VGRRSEPNLKEGPGTLSGAVHRSRLQGDRLRSKDKKEVGDIQGKKGRDGSAERVSSQRLTSKSHMSSQASCVRDLLVAVSSTII